MLLATKRNLKNLRRKELKRDTERTRTQTHLKSCSLLIVSIGFIATLVKLL